LRIYLYAHLSMDAVALRVRDRFLIRKAVDLQYTDSVRIAAWSPPKEQVLAIAEAFWEPRLATDKQAFGGIMRAVGKLLKLVKRAPRAWPAIQKALGLDEMEGLSLIEKGKILGTKLKELAKEGKRALGKILKGASAHFPLSLFFTPKNKLPGLTDLMVRILDKVPWAKKALGKIHAGSVKVDDFFKKYLPHLRRPLYGAIFVWIWFNVAELSWDLQGLIAGFTGSISLPELLASMPESGIGLIAASFGLGYGALPVTLIARFIWLVANHYLEWIPGKGLKVRWSSMGVEQPDELVAAAA